MARCHRTFLYEGRCLTDNLLTLTLATTSLDDRVDLLQIMVDLFKTNKIMLHLINKSGYFEYYSILKDNYFQIECVIDQKDLNAVKIILQTIGCKCEI